MRQKKHRFKPFFLILVLLLICGAAVFVAWLAQPPTPSDPGSVQGSESDQTSLPGTLTDSQSVPTSDTSAQTTNSQSDTDDRSETDDRTDTDDRSDTDTSSQKTSSSQSTIIPPPPSDGTAKRIAFTFDDGPHAEITKLIADEFAKYGGKCTYFVVGNRVRGSQEAAMKYAASLGNEIGIHGYTHTVYYNNCSNQQYESELRKTAEAIVNATGTTPLLMRPIGGGITKARVNSCPYAVILWNVDTRDWENKKENRTNIVTIANNILSDASDGDIVLMHDIYYNTYEAIKIVLPILKEQGYEFVTVSELFGDRLSSGTKYYNSH